ncbi:MAG: hypothetical protein H7A33_07585 [Deltaproteobacteria bacterium]|nr:hypothetical protein [Deltaproteobacteria bacterium]
MLGTKMTGDHVQRHHGVLAFWNARRVLDSLQKAEPAGRSALKEALKKALSSKPNQIFVVVDGGDGCDPMWLEGLESDLKIAANTGQNFSWGYSRKMK